MSDSEDGVAPGATPGPSTSKGVQFFADLSQEHSEFDVDYPQVPPVGGVHDPAWLNCNGQVYADPVRDENAVHSMEHGAVWVTYRADVTDTDVAALTQRVEGKPYVFMSPYLDQPDPIMVTAWGVQLGVDSTTDDRLDDFLVKYRQGDQTPEPGAPCDGGVES